MECYCQSEQRWFFFAYVESRKAGQIRYHFPKPNTVEILYSGVKAKYRNRGVATKMYFDFRTFIKMSHPQVKWCVGRVGSKGILRLRNKVFGKPIKIGKGIKSLPELSPKSRFPSIYLPKWAEVTHEV